MRYEITHICERVKDTQWETGRVAGIYNNCFNVLTDGNELLTFFRKTDRYSTRAILTDICESMQYLPIEDGMTVTRLEKSIHAGKVVFGTDHPKIIPAKRSRIAACADIGRNIGILKNVLKKYGKKSPVLENELLSAKVKRGFDLLIKNPVQGFEALVGLGAGLTPSCDDIISGMAAYFHLNGIGSGFNTQLAEYLNAKGDTVTTAVSKNLLCDTSVGYINNSLYELIYAVMNDGNSIEEKALDMIDYGSTSGTETCYGVITGYLLNEKKELIEWL